MVALSFVGSAILLFSCEDAAVKSDPSQNETLMTEYCENLSIVMSQNGRRSYIFDTPLLEGYTQAREPYREFRRGVKITTFKDDSLSTVNSVLTANYAIYYEKLELWEAKGNVVVEKSDGTKLYTQQLFWNARTRRIYSNVDSKIVQRGGRGDAVGEGFESDEELTDWRFRRSKGRFEVDVQPVGQSDSTAASRRERPVPPDLEARADDADSAVPAGSSARDAQADEARAGRGSFPPSVTVRPPARDTRSDELSAGRSVVPPQTGTQADNARPEVQKMQQLQKTQKMEPMIPMQTMQPMQTPAAARVAESEGSQSQE